MEQIERIQRMEHTLQEAKTVCRALEEALERWEAMEKDVGALSEYYGSELWFFDLDCDRAGLLPAALPRGVLSEDEAYDLLCDWRELQERMRALSGDPSGQEREDRTDSSL
ncbi:MAG: DUF4298 domain-containing protein [Clostridia bacterium]